MPNEGPWNVTAKPFPTPATLYYLSVSFRKWNAISTNRYLFRGACNKTIPQFYLWWRHQIFLHETDAHVRPMNKLFSYYSDFVLLFGLSEEKIDVVYTKSLRRGAADRDMPLLKCLLGDATQRTISTAFICWQENLRGELLIISKLRTK